MKTYNFAELDEITIYTDFQEKEVQQQSSEEIEITYELNIEEILQGEML